MAELKRHRILQEVEANGIVALRRALARDDEEENVVRARREASLGTDAIYEEPAADDPANASEESSSRDDAGWRNRGWDGHATGAPHFSAFTHHDPSCKTNPIPNVEEVSSSGLRASSGDLPLQNSHFTRQTHGFASCTPGD
jgi:hypothetical protein